MIERSPRWRGAKAYRELRTNLNFLDPDMELEKLIITSAGPKEGKSLTVANLGFAIAQGGEEVIIIDADLHQPQQHNLYQVSNELGLSDILSGNLELEKVLQTTPEKNLKIIPSGTLPPSPVELFDSSKMEKVLRWVNTKGDLVIIDTPPVNAVTDTLVLASKADGVLLLAEANQTKKQMLKKAQERLEKAKANLLGVVLNKYPVKKGPEYYYYQYEYKY